LIRFVVIFEEKVFHIVSRISGPPHICYSLFFKTFRFLCYGCHLKSHSKLYHGRKPILV